MSTAFRRWSLRLTALLALAIVVMLGFRIYYALQPPLLEPWHTYVPKELDADALDHTDWNAYVKDEERIFEDMRAAMRAKIGPEAKTPSNRYFEGSPVFPGHFARDWNRSYELLPEGTPVGAVVLLHGLTDSPYSLRNVARSYRDHGYVVVAIRLPGHGTVPAGLTNVTWQQWTAATRLAVREARAHINPAQPLHVVGFSNGGALAVQYALNAVEDPNLTPPNRLVLLSPMIGITRFARFAGVMGLPALLPAFDKASWLGIVPEFNPFKYNSFPVNAARESFRLTQVVQSQITRLAQSGHLNQMPPVLTFQSVIDFTVSTPAILTALYSQLPANGSEIVLFDVNHAITVNSMLNASALSALTRLLPTPPLRYRITVITNATGADGMVQRVLEPGDSQWNVRPLELRYPPKMFSLSHVAVPFPMSDPLYGMEPEPTEDFGVQLGVLAPRAERGALMISMDALFRSSSNPFFPYMIERIEDNIDGHVTATTLGDTVTHEPYVSAPQSTETPYEDADDSAFNVEP